MTNTPASYHGDASLSSASEFTNFASFLHHFRSIHELYAYGETYAEIHVENEKNRFLWSKYISDTSFKFKVEAYNHTIPQRRQKEVVESFSYMGWLGKIDMKTPEVTLSCFEECRTQLFVSPSVMLTKIADSDKRGSPASPRHRHDGDGDCVSIYFGRLVCSSAIISVNK